MSKELTFYGCETCNTAYPCKEEADQCEKEHAIIEDLQINDIFYETRDRRYPDKIIISDDKHSGDLALYELKKVACMEYFAEEYYTHDRRKLREEEMNRPYMDKLIKIRNMCENRHASCRKGKFGNKNDCRYYNNYWCHCSIKGTPANWVFKEGLS